MLRNAETEPEKETTKATDSDDDDRGKKGSREEDKK